MWKFFLISLALIQAIECRTNQEVIDDFEQVFQERDDEFTALENVTKNTMMPKFQNFEIEIFRQQEIIFGELIPNSVDRIIENITDYIKVIGLDEKPDLTKSCLETLNKTLADTKNILTGEGRSCSNLPVGKYAMIYLNNYTDVMQRMENEHGMLNVTKEECIKLNSPFEVQTCVINDLYTFYIPYLKEVTEYIHDLIDDWSNQLIRIQNEDVTPCFELIQNDIIMFEQSIIDDTKICLWFIPQKTNV